MQQPAWQSRGDLNDQITTSEESQIRQALELILTPAWERGDVVELGALKASKGTVSGYFDRDHLAQLVAAAVRWSGDAQGVCITLNPVLRHCLGRAANRAKTFSQNTTTDNAEPEKVPGTKLLTQPY